MASRWRVWEGEAHVDSHGYSETHTNVFVPVPHTLDWKDIQETLKDFVISEDLKEKIQKSSHVNNNVKKFKMKGVKKVRSPNSVIRGRAEVLRMRLGARAPGSSSLRGRSISKLLAEHEKEGVSSQATPPREFIPDDQTLYFKHLPNNLTEKELRGSVSQFGEVSMCIIHQGESESMGFVRLEEASACDWVISYYRGMPYDDNSAPLECDFAVKPASYQ